MTHASLFSGIGGFDLAAEWCGWENMFHCEWNEFGKRVLAHHFPKATQYGDITKTDFTQWRGKVDVLTGGFPCQPFSTAGLRRGADDDRYLWPHMLRAIKEIQPTWVVGENVAGITSMVQPSEEIEVGDSTHLFNENYITREEQRFTLEEILQSIEREGYDVQTFIIPACAVGAPHRRDRVWIVAQNSDHIRCNSSERKIKSEARRQRKPSSGGNERLRIRKERSFANSRSARSRKSMRNKSERQENFKRRFKRVEFRKAGCNGSVTNTNNARVESLKRKRTIGAYMPGPSTNTMCEERRRECECRSEERKSIRCSIKDAREQWAKFPTQPPICGRDDGIPRELDAITFPKWRQESTKAYGNAIVPQVAMMIFSAINEIESNSYEDLH